MFLLIKKLQVLTERVWKVTNVSFFKTKSFSSQNVLKSHWVLAIHTNRQQTNRQKLPGC
jgi:hypothetical protein